MRLLQTRTARSTGTRVSVRVHEGSGTYRTTCETHQRHASAPTRRAATCAASRPEEWCDPCAAALESRQLDRMINRLIASMSAGDGFVANVIFPRTKRRTTRLSYRRTKR